MVSSTKSDFSSPMLGLETFQIACFGRSRFAIGERNGTDAGDGAQGVHDSALAWIEAFGHQAVDQDQAFTPEIPDPPSA